MPAKCPKCGAQASLEAIREAGGRCPGCKARVKIKFTGVPRPVTRPPGPAPSVRDLRGALERIGPYEVVSEISRGGMGIVYKARDKNLKKTVAIKVLIRGGQASEEERKRFRREAEAAARLQHSNIVPIHSVGVCDGLPYFVMDFIDGEQLDELIARRAITPRQALDVTEQLADALAYAHAAGVIHRDIKPANVIIDRYSRPQLMDFGLAKEVDSGDRTQLTQVGTTMGTPTYMPPEQAEGDLLGIDAQSDVYALGAVLYEMLTGQPPFEGPTTMAILMKVLEEEPPRPRVLNPRIHPDIETICLKAMAKDKRERYLSAEHLREDIRRFKAGEAIAASRPGALRNFSRWVRRHREVVAVALLAVIGLGSWVGYDIWQRQEDRAAAERARIARVERLLADADGLLAGEAPDEAAMDSAARLYRQALDQEPPREAAERAQAGLARIEKMIRDRRINALVFMGEVFLRESNYKAAAHVFELVLRDYDPGEKRAKLGLRVAKGDGTLTVASEPAGAEVYLGTGEGFAEPPPGTPADKLGRRLGTTPLPGPVDVPMGLHRVTLVRKGFGRQSVPVRVGRNQDVLLDKVTLVSGEAVGGEEAAANLVPVPGGNVLLDDGSTREVDAFYMDRYEYPNRLGVRPVCGATRRPEDGAWSWQAAQDLAREAGKQLPTRSQWLLAASGPDALRFPYGREFDPERAAVALADKDGPLPCGSRPGDRSPFGLYDMGGNASEWVRPEQEPAFLEEEFRDACGGSWMSREPDQSSCRHVRFYTPADDVSAVGLRCVLEKGQKVTPRVPSEPGTAPAGARFEEAWVDKCPPDMVLVRPEKGTRAWDLVDYPFCIDKYEWPNEAGKPPRSGVSWEEANRLARAKGRRLPTRDEWRVACGGPDLWEFSFGPEYAEGRAWIGRSGLEETPPVSGAGIAPGEGEEKKPALSPFGACDLTGSLLEWVWRARDDGRHAAIGGSWISSREEAQASYWPVGQPAARNKVVGFRCVVRLREKPSGGE